MGGLTAYELKGTFCSDRNVLELDPVNGFTTINILKISTELYTLKW